MHAVNNFPTVPNDIFGLYGKMKEAGIPFARFHDTGGSYGGTHYIDITNVFPDFSADENDVQSYDFAFTDELLKHVVKNGVKPFYRLGQTIENYQYIKAYNIYPPADPEKWARVCEMIIRHYNEGWNNGFRYNIEYWEIWNEPDNEPQLEDNPMWKGTKEQYFTLYSVTYSHLKKCFPELKIGGYSSCGFYALSSADYSRLANSSPRTDYFIEFFHDFLKYIKKNGIGLDFFSWHSYAAVADNVGYADYARKTLDEYGYKNTEIFLNEWNPGINNRGKLIDAAKILECMCRMQNTPTDMCMYYDAQIKSGYCGLFDPLSHGVLKAYYAFYLFNKLYQMKYQTECSVSSDELCVLAASDGKNCGIIFVNTSDGELEVNFKSGVDGKFKLYRVDDNHECTAEDESAEHFSIPAYGIAYAEKIQ